MGLKKREVLGLQSSQEPVCAMIGVLGLGHGNRVTSS
jgi:hypothetical protein